MSRLVAILDEHRLEGIIVKRKDSTYREGKEPGQGVGSLDDGTMVVIQNGRRLLNQTITAVVTSVIQTSAGRMIFAEPASTESRRPANRVKPREESA